MSETQKAAMKKVMASNPDLTDFGIGVFEQAKKTPDAIKQEMAVGRERLLTQEALKQFETARSWLSQFAKTKSINKTGTSYGLKHKVEHSLDTYVANGVFIAAAVAEGFRIAQSDASPNVYLNISMKAWRAPKTPT